MRYYQFEGTLGQGEMISIPYREVCGDFGDFSDTSALLSLLPRGDMRYGEPAAMARRAKIYAEIGLEESRVYSPPLKHTRNVAVLRRWTDPIAWRQGLEESGGADGVLADGVLADGDLADGADCREGSIRGLAVTVADCMPIWLFDRRRAAYGILHSGWKGTGILARAVERMEKDFYCAKEDILAIFGPSIGSCCYRVDEGRATAFAKEFGKSSVVEEGSPEDRQYFLDLRKANLGIAREIGLGAVFDIECCTACSPNLGSFRRQGADAFTRMLALAVSGLPNIK
jgi:YfiH family protein